MENLDTKYNPSITFDWENILFVGTHVVIETSKAPGVGFQPVQIVELTHKTLSEIVIGVIFDHLTRKSIPFVASIHLLFS